MLQIVLWLDKIGKDWVDYKGETYKFVVVPSVVQFLWLREICGGPQQEDIFLHPSQKISSTDCTETCLSYPSNGKYAKLKDGLSG